MKKILLAIIAMFTVESLAFTGSANEAIDAIRASAQLDSGGRPDDLVGIGIYRGKVMGAAAVYADAGFEDEICVPEGVNGGQIATITTRYILDNPDKWHESLSLLTWAAMYQTWGLASADDCQTRPTE